MKKIISVIFILFSCTSNKLPKITTDFSLLLQNKDFSKNNNSNLIFNGFYMEEGYNNPYYPNVFSANAIFFFRNGLIYSQASEYKDSAVFAKTIVKHSREKGAGVNWGCYIIEKDTLKAIMLCEFYGKREQSYKYYQCYYSGIIDKKGKISNWKMEHPYPKINMEFNKGSIESESKPRNLKFKLFPAKALIDSDKVWINEYRNMK